MLEAGRFPFMEVVGSTGTWSLVEWAYVDTGYEGGLLIPVEFRDEVLAAAERVPLRLADGSIVKAPAWRGTVQIDEHTFPAEIAALSPRLLLGRQITDRLNICLEFGQRVTVAFAD